MLAYCWSSVFDAGPALSQYWLLCLLGGVAQRALADCSLQAEDGLQSDSRGKYRPVPPQPPPLSGAQSWPWLPAGYVYGAAHRQTAASFLLSLQWNQGSRFDPRCLYARAASYVNNLFVSECIIHSFIPVPDEAHSQHVWNKKYTLAYAYIIYF